MWKEKGKKPIFEFLILTFAISWGFEGVIIGLEQMKLLPSSVEKGVVMALIGLGARIRTGLCYLYYFNKISYDIRN